METGSIYFILFFALMAVFFYWLVAIYTPKWKKKQAEQKDALASNHSKIKEELGIKQEYGGMFYETGHPDIINPIGPDKFFIAFSNDKLHLIESNSGIRSKLAEIPFNHIENVKAEDVSFFQKKTSGTDMLLYGVAAAKIMKNDVKVNKHYVIVEWKDGKFNHATIFSFTGDKSIAQSNELRSLIIKYSNNNQN